MAQLKVPVDNFHLLCNFTCCTRDVYDLVKEDYVDCRYLVKYPPKLVSKTITFNVNIPNGATIEKAQLYATIGSPLHGVVISTINGVSVGADHTACVDIEIADGATSVDVPFSFLCDTPSHQHSILGETHADEVWQSGNYEYEDYLFPHTSTLTYSDVYLLIEYRPAIEFSGWTDDPLSAGVTYVKAVHMTELQQWTAMLSEYADNGTPTFTEAIPGETSLGLWLSQVQELRAVLDVVDPDHEAWIDVSVNCPRADVMTQLREIIVAAM